MTCPYCGSSVSPGSDTCSVCGNTLPDTFVDELMEVDVAHSGESWEDARRKIEKAVDTCLLRQLKGVRIIHGRGDRGFHTGIIARKAVPYMRKLAQSHGGRCVQDDHNSGAHIIYFY